MSGLQHAGIDGMGRTSWLSPSRTFRTRCLTSMEISKALSGNQAAIELTLIACIFHQWCTNIADSNRTTDSIVSPHVDQTLSVRTT